jgi:hypothetical protein
LSGGLLDTVRPLLGYVICIAIIVILAGISFLATVSAELTSSATVMATLMTVIALLIGVTAASRAAREA